MPSRSLRLLLCVLLLVISSFTLQAQSSQTTSEIAKPLWSVLLQSTTNLPPQIDSLMLSSQTQIDALKANNEQLSNSNDLLRQQNTALQTSLKASQAALATSEEQRKQLGIQLSASISSIIQAQQDAKALEAERNLWRIAGVGGGILAVVAVIIAVVK